MTAFALAGKCGLRGLRSVWIAEELARAKSAWRSDASAAPQIPPGILRKKSRRVNEENMLSSNKYCTDPHPQLIPLPISYFSVVAEIVRFAGLHPAIFPRNTSPLPSHY